MASDHLTQNMANLTLSSKQPRKKAPLIDFSATERDILNYAQHLLSKYKGVVEFKKETELSYNVKNERGSDQENGHDWTQNSYIRKAKDFQFMKSETDRISKNCQHKYNNSVQKPKYDQWSLMKVICEESDRNRQEDTKDEDLVSVYIDHKKKKIYDLSMGVVQARYHHNKWIETLKKYKEIIENYFDSPANENLTASTHVSKPNGLPFCEAEDLITIKKLLKPPQTSTENDIPCLSKVVEDQKIKLLEWFSDEFIEIIHTPSSPRNSDTQPSSGRADSPSRTKNERNEMRRLNDTLATPTKMSTNNSGRQSGSGSDRSGSDREKENKENNVPNEIQNKPKVKGLLDTPDKAMLCDNPSRMEMIPRPREIRDQSWRNNGLSNRRVSDPEALISPPSMPFRPRNHKIAEEKPKNQIVSSENPNPKIQNQNGINREPEGRVPFTKVQNRYQNNRFQNHHSNNGLQNRGRNHNGYNNYNNNNSGKQQIVNPKTGYQPRNTSTASNQANTFQVPALPGNTENLTKMSNSNTSLKENNPVTIASSNFSTKAEPFRPKNVGQTAAAADSASVAAVLVPENQTASKKIDLKKLNVSSIAAFVPRNPLVAVQNN